MEYRPKPRITKPCNGAAKSGVFAVVDRSSPPADGQRSANECLAKHETLMFINPMWDHESQRLGKKRCTPIGFMLHTISDLIGFIALLFMLAISFYLMYTGFRGIASWSSLWLYIIPFAIAIVGNLLHGYSWHLARKRQFEYDYDRCVATWIDEHGKRQSYKYETAKASDNKLDDDNDNGTATASRLR